MKKNVLSRISRPPRVPLKYCSFPNNNLPRRLTSGSIDKVLVATAEHAVYDAVRRLLPGVVEMDDSTAGTLWRSEYLYSRAATIYGGTAEVQRNIIARRLLDLGRDD